MRNSYYVNLKTGAFLSVTLIVAMSFVNIQSSFIFSNEIDFVVLI